MTENKQIVRTMFDRLNTGDTTGAAAFVADDLVNHAAIPEAQGRKGFVAIIAKVRAAIPDLNYTCEDLIADGDRVVARLTVTGTHTGPLDMTRFQLPATHRTAKFEQIHIARLAGGKVVEYWMCQDSFALFRQLGLEVRPAA
jgi:predicted ester cyclase